MANIPQKIIHQHLRHNKKFPHVWCAGCSHGIVLGSTIRAVAELNLAKDDVTMISGIGCSSRMPVYADFNTCHSIHGRAIAFATGVKLFKPEQNVLVVTGDGDATAIGGNHFIHACRRNINLTILILNNNIYGMTGGQYSPTTPTGAKATTTPYGNIDPVFDICNLALGAGATFVARTTAFHTMETQKVIKQGIEHTGISVIEIVSSCPVIYGKLNKKGTPADMLRWMKDNTITIAESQKLPPEKLDGKLIRGIFKQEIRPEYTDSYQKLIESTQVTKEAKK
ncbi:MAG: 2-oxoacid:ferredoxin oxidoreductase subunit beta [Candidatus Cloacimonetes bacterium]|nr:2-oxoacid:ferredoxin oxidoreductase subunit beta [Candidatus Cloacimonadota bacterium]